MKYIILCTLLLISFSAYAKGPADLTVTTRHVGFSESVRAVYLYPMISGYLSAVHVKTGATVKKGDVLFEIDPRPYRNKVSEAKAETEIQKANLKNAEDYLNRLSKTNRDAVSRMEKETAENHRKEAFSAYQNALAVYQNAKVEEGYTKIKAPISGKVGNVSLNSGEFVSPQGKPMLFLIADDKMKVRFSLPLKEALNPHFRLKSVRAELADGTIRPVQNIVSDNQANQGTSSVSFYGEVSGENLMPNMPVVVLLEREFHQVYRVPKEKVLLTPKGNFVLTDKGKYPAEIVFFDKNDYLIRADLPENISMTEP